VLTSLGFKDFKLKLNHRLVLNGLLEQAGVPTPQQGDALVALDKMDKTGPEGVARELVARGIPGESAVRLMRFFEGLAGAQRAAGLMELEAEELAYNTGVLGRLVEFIGSHEQGARGIDELRQIIQFATASGISSRIKLDPTLARGLSYYSGAIMEISVKDLPGSLGGGGRYDNLVGMFAGEDIPACGFSLGLERIIVVMTEREMFPASLATSPADVLVASLGEEFLSAAVNLATDLRRTGIRVSMYPEAASKPQKPLSYADAQKIPLAILIGEDEHKNGVITVRNLVERQQERPLRDRAVEVVTGMLSAVPKTHG
jgi:histidyl-tRNA synthetase